MLGQQAYSRRTVPDLLERSRALGELRPVVFDLATGQELSYSAFLGRVAKAAARLAGRFAPGDRIAVLAGNSLDYFILRYALACAGLVEVAVNGNHRGPVLEHMLHLTRPRAIIVEDAYLDNLETAAVALQGVERLSGDEMYTLTASPGAWNDRPRIPIDPRDPARILFTSGTTGRSKAVELSHAYEVHTGERHVGLIGLQPRDRWLYVTPMFHIDAVYITSILLHTGGTFTVAPDFSVSRFWDDVGRSGATYVSHLGAILGLLLKGPDPPKVTTLRVAVGGGASAGQIAAVEERFGLHVLEAFAMTECIACTINRFGERRIGTAGRAIDGYEVVIKAPDGTVLPAGVTGEITVRSVEPSGLFTRYVGDDRATDEAVRDGWFHTGDLGVLDDDGYLTHRGRMKDAIRVKGENISAMELETIADRHEAVTRSAAVGVAADIGDEDILLYVECADTGLDPERLFAFIDNNAAAFFRPRYIVMVAKLPLTATGKVDKSALPRSPSASAWVRSPGRR